MLIPWHCSISWTLPGALQTHGCKTNAAPRLAGCETFSAYSEYHYTLDSQCTMYEFSSRCLLSCNRTLPSFENLTAEHWPKVTMTKHQVQNSRKMIFRQPGRVFRSLVTVSKKKNIWTTVKPCYWGKNIRNRLATLIVMLARSCKFSLYFF